MNTERDTRLPIPDYEELFETEATYHKDGSGIIGRVLKQNAWQIALSCVLFEIKQSLMWIYPLFTANLINILTSGEGNVWQKILPSLIVLLVLFAVHIPTNVVYCRHVDTMIRTISAGMRRTVIRKLQRLSLLYHKEIETGRVQAKFIRDIEQIEFLTTQIVKTLIPDIITLFIYIGIVAYKAPWIAVLFVLVAPVSVGIMRIFQSRMRRENSQFRRENEHMSSQVSEMLTMLPVTKAHGLEDEGMIELERNIKELRLKALRVDYLNSYFASSGFITYQFFNCLCLLFSAFLALKNWIDVGDIVLFTSYFASVISTLNMIINMLPELSKGIESLRSVSEIMLSNDVEEDKDKIKLRYVHGHLKFDDVSFRYPNTEEDAIKHFSLAVNPGECVAFVGASGSGKSTIMNMIIGFMFPTSGTYLVDGKPIEALNLSSYRHFLSVVPQNSILMSGTIRDNITFGMPNVDEKRLQEVLELANINEFLPSLPNGIDTLIGENGGKLSGGQKQRICIARALIRDPKILILDEATSALDNISEYHVQKAISALIRNRTTFIVAHRLSTIRDADRIVVMDGGEIVEMGTYEELMAKKGKFYELKTLSDVTLENA